MDIRVVESVATSGAMKDPVFRVDSGIENVSLVWSQEDRALTLVDYNLDYNFLPHKFAYTLNGSGIVKKTFLTYNGKNCETGQMLETVLIESNSELDANYIPGYANSNEWKYTPADFNYNPEFKEFTNIADYANQPYDYSQGFTVVKQFLTSGGNITPGSQSPYTAFYRVPTLTSFLPSNVENNRIYTDGWYTSYVIACRTWSSYNFTTTNLPSKGDIVYHNNKFYKNVTGLGVSLVQDPKVPTTTVWLIPDPAHWSAEVSFADWLEFIKHYDSVLASNKCYYIETQHLVTAELNEAILSELKCQCSCCDNPDFDTSKILAYMKLMQKRLGAYVLFNEEIFHEAQCVVESSRQICSICLYNKKVGGCC